MKRFLLLLLLTPAALGATYNVALPGGGVLTVNGLPYVNPGITNSASVVWGVDGTGLLYATATGTNSSIVYVEGAAVAGPNFGLSTEIDPAVTASTNITFSLVNSSITTNKIDATFYSLLMQTGAGDVTQAGNNTFTGTNIFQSSTTISNLTVDALEANSLTLNTPIGVTAVGTNAADARTQLGVAYDVDVQAYRLQLLQAALALTASGHMIYHNGTLVTNLTSTSPGRYLLTAATATDQRNSLVVGELDQTVYSAAWDGVTNKTPTLDSIYDWGQALPGGSNAITTWNTNYFSVSGGYLDWVGGATGGGSGYTYLVTNVGGAFQSRTASTNWVILSTTVSSNYAPSATGKFLEGGYGLVLSNNSGTTANLNMRIKVNETTVFQDAPASLTTGSLRAAAEDFRIVRSSDTTAAIVSVGSYVVPTASIGLGDFGGSSPLGNAKVITNVAWNWSTNNTLAISVDCDTSTSTNDAVGMTVIAAHLRAEGAAGSGTGDVVGPASSTDSVVALYDGTTGKLLKNGTLTEAIIKNATNITAGTLSSNRLPADVAFTTAGIGTITATTVTVNGTNLMSEIASKVATRTGVARTLTWAANALSGESFEPATPFTNTFATTTDRSAEECWRFSATVTNGVRGSFTWPLTWNAGTVNVRLWLKQLVAEASSTNVFRVALGSAASGDTGGALLGTEVIVKITGENDTNKVTSSAWSSAITVGNTPAAGDRGFLSVRRLPGHTDDQSSVEAVLMGLDLEYTESTTEPTDN